MQTPAAVAVVILEGHAVKAGAVLTVSVAEDEVTLPLLLVNFALYKYPFNPNEEGLIVSVEVVTPAEEEVLTLYGLAIVRVLNPKPLLISQSTFEGGVLLADAVNEVEARLQTETSDGFVLMVGAAAPSPAANALNEVLTELVVILVAVGVPEMDGCVHVEPSYFPTMNDAGVVPASWSAGEL